MSIVQIKLRKLLDRHGKLYALFVDLRRAFDSINHIKLWRKLSSLGVSSKVINILSCSNNKSPGIDGIPYSVLKLLPENWITMIVIYLPKPVLSHGQLYTAFSRAKAAADVKIQIKETDEQGHLKKNRRVHQDHCLQRNI